MINILLIGGTGGAQVLAALSKAGHQIATVIDTEPAQRGHASLADVARNQGLSIWQPTSLKAASLADDITNAGVDIVLCVRCRSVLSPEIVASPRLGSYNLHLGPLPDYAGRNVVNWAIYNGEAEHGVTLHRMSPEVDRGGIVSMSRFPIAATDTALSVTRRCLKEGMSLIVTMLDTIKETGQAPAVVEQPATGGFFYMAKDRPDMSIDWGRSSAEILRLARACDFHPFPSPWGLPRTTYAGRTLDVLRLEAYSGSRTTADIGSVLSLDDGAAIVTTGDGTVRLQSFLIDGVVREAAEILEPHTRLGTPA